MIEADRDYLEAVSFMIPHCAQQRDKLGTVTEAEPCVP